MASSNRKSRSKRERGRVHTWARRLAQVGIGIALLACLWLLACSLSPWRPYVVDLSAQASWRGWMLSGALLGVCGLARFRVLGLAAFVLCVAQLASNRYAGPPLAGTLPAPGSEAVRIGFANLGPPGRDPTDAVLWLLERDPDVLVLVESGNWHLDQLPVLEETYPHIVRQVRGKRWARLILRRYPFASGGLTGDGVAQRATSFVSIRSATVRLDGGTLLTVSGAHYPSPRTRSVYEASIEEALQDAALLSSWMNENGHATVAVGDFNSTLAGAVARAFARRSGLRIVNPRVDGGTWPAPLPRMLSVPIDHAFVSEGVSAIDRRVSPRFDGDHRAVIVDLAVPTD